MILNQQNVLFFSRSTQHGGTENVILQLCEALRPHVNKIVIASAEGIENVALRELNIKYYRLPDIEKKNLGTILEVKKKLRLIIKKEKITIIHTHHRMAAFYCQFINTKKITLLNTAHTVFFDKKLLTEISYMGMNIIACGNTVKESLVKYQGIEESRITVISNAIKPFTKEVEPVREITEAKRNGFIVSGVIGRLSHEKGVLNLVDAVNRIKDMRIHFFIIGSGDEEELIRTKIHDNELEEYFTFLGYRTDSQNIASQLDFLVLPSLQEGLPLVPIEAFSVSTPVIATNVGGSKEVVIDGVNGILVEPNDCDAMANAIRKMGQADLHEYGKNALRTYRERFSFDVFECNYLTYYKKL